MRARLRTYEEALIQVVQGNRKHLCYQPHHKRQQVNKQNGHGGRGNTQRKCVWMKCICIMKMKMYSLEFPLGSWWFMASTLLAIFVQVFLWNEVMKLVTLLDLTIYNGIIRVLQHLVHIKGENVRSHPSFITHIQTNFLMYGLGHNMVHIKTRKVSTEVLQIFSFSETSSWFLTT